MRFIFLIFIFFSIERIQAQIVIPFAAPSASEVFDFKEAGQVFAIDYKAAGQNIVWDFSTVVAVDDVSEVYLSSFSVPFQFYPAFTNPISPPISNIARENPAFDFPGPGFDIDDSYIFYHTSNDAFLDMGFAFLINSIPITARYDNPEVILEFPLTFSNQWSSESTADVDIPSLAYWQQQRESSSEVDAYGQLILPNNVSVEVLKVTTTVLVKDSIFNYVIGFPFSPPARLETSYRWYAESYNLPVFEVLTQSAQAGGNEQVTLVRYKEINVNNVNSPNDFIDHFYVHENIAHISLKNTNEKIKLNIYDVSGRKVKDYQVLNRSDYKIDLNSLQTSGVYYLHFQTKSGMQSVKSVFIP
ncbi:MAG: T9SS C-terminal target domain-containing protein [Chitinophagaceae bacterium]|nr:MAG: T9SS C-terminal target domain-containing protein [Chitinophagaceae bacterium]